LEKVIGRLRINCRDSGRGNCFFSYPKCQRGSKVHPIYYSLLQGA